MNRRVMNHGVTNNRAMNRRAMNRRVTRLLLALYPRAWRDRYGAEVASLTDELIRAGETTPLPAGLNLVAGAAAERARALAGSRSALAVTSAAAIAAMVGGAFVVTGGARPGSGPRGLASANCLVEPPLQVVVPAAVRLRPLARVQPRYASRLGPTQSGLPPAGPPQSGPFQSGPPSAGLLQSGPPSAGLLQSAPPSAAQPSAGRLRVQPRYASRLGPAQSGLPPAGPPQSGPPSAGLLQSGPPSAGRPPSGLLQSGLPSAGPPQSGLPSAGRPRSGRRDRVVAVAISARAPVLEGRPRVVVVRPRALLARPDRVGYIRPAAIRPVLRIARSCQRTSAVVQDPVPGPARKLRVRPPVPVATRVTR